MATTPKRRTKTAAAKNGDAPVTFRVETDNIHIGDLALFQDFVDSKVQPGDLLDFLERVVVGDVRSLPLRCIGEIFDVAMAEIAEGDDPN